MKPYIHEVKYYECDRMGITHHSNYIRFMEEARIDLQDQMGYSLGKMEEEGVVSPVVSLSCNYRKTTTFKDRIEIEESIVNVSPLKMKLAYTMKVGEDIVFTGESVHCFLENGHPVRIDERFPVFILHSPLLTIIGEENGYQLPERSSMSSSGVKPSFFICFLSFSSPCCDVSGQDTSPS